MGISLISLILHFTRDCLIDKAISAGFEPFNHYWPEELVWHSFSHCHTYCRFATHLSSSAIHLDT